MLFCFLFVNMSLYGCENVKMLPPLTISTKLHDKYPDDEVILAVKFRSDLTIIKSLWELKFCGTLKISRGGNGTSSGVK